MAQRDSRTIILGGSLIAGAALVGLAMWYFMAGGRQHLPDSPTTPAGAGQIAATPSPERRSGRLTLRDASAMSNIQVGGAPGVTTTALIAEESPVSIVGVDLAPATPEIAIMADGSACRANRILQTGESCVVSVTWRPTTPGSLSRQLVIRTNGSPATLATEIRGNAVAPPDTTPSTPAQVVVAPPAPQFLYPDENAELLNSRGGITVIKAETSANKRSPNPGWSSIGIERQPSSAPVDRTRVITADRHIPAVLEVSIDSRQCGPITAKVERNLFGSDGRTILIPRGSTILGKCESAEKLNDQKVSMNVSRIERPDGVRYRIDGLVADAMGRYGVPGDVQDEVWANATATVLTSALTAATTVELGGQSNTITSPLGSVTQSNDARARASQQFGQDISTLAKKIINDKLDMRPIITIPKGTRIEIVPQADLWLRDWDEPAPAPREASASSIGQLFSGGPLAPAAPTMPSTTPPPRSTPRTPPPAAPPFPDASAQPDIPTIPSLKLDDVRSAARAAQQTRPPEASNTPTPSPPPPAPKQPSISIDPELQQ